MKRLNDSRLMQFSAIFGAVAFVACQKTDGDVGRRIAKQRVGNDSSYADGSPAARADDNAASDASVVAAGRSRQEELDALNAAVPDSLGGDGECQQDEEGFADHPDLCEWVAVGDATVVATIEGFERLAEPAWGFPPDAPGGRLLVSGEECRPSTAALAIDIRVEEAWYGAVPRTVRVRVGGEQVDYFVPHPTTVDPETGELGPDQAQFFG